MHYYLFNIGDYRRQTSHLTLLEHGIYRALLDSYYLQEGPLCADDAKLMRSHCVRTNEEKEAFYNVLDDFFIKQEDGYHHSTCEDIIDQYKNKSQKAKASAEARWSKAGKKCAKNANASKKDANAYESDANAYETQCKGNADGMLTNNHKPITNNQRTNTTTSEHPSDDVVLDGGVGEIYEFYLNVMNKTRNDVKLTSKKADLIANAVKIYGLETCRRAIRGCLASKFHQGANKHAQVYDRIENIFKSQETVEMLRDRCPEVVNGLEIANETKRRLGRDFRRFGSKSDEQQAKKI